MGLVERERELSVLEDVLKRAIDGQGAVAVIEGDAGIGKTTLLAAASELAGGHGVRVLRALGGELERELPFAIVRQLFEPVLKAGSAAFRAELLADAAGLAAPVFGPDAAPHPVADATASIVHGLYWVCSNLAEHGPMLIVVDDAHWADESSLRFVSHLVRRLSDLKIVLLLATRPRDWAGRLDDALTGVRPKVVRLEPLSDAAIAGLVRDEFGRHVDEDFCAACATVTGGNPFLLSEALNSIRATSTVPGSMTARQLERLGSESVARSVFRRLARHGPRAGAVAHAVAILGPDAELHRVAALAQTTEPEAGLILEALERDALVTGTAPIAFIHPLVRSAVYDDMAAVTRAATHKRVVGMLRAEGQEAARLVPHLLLSVCNGDAETVEALLAAARDSLASGAPEVAAQCLERALIEPPPAAELGPINTLLGRALGYANRIVDAEAALRAGLAMTTDVFARGEIALELGWLLVIIGKAGAARAALVDALANVPPDHPEQARRLEAALSASGFMSLDPPETWTPLLPSVDSVADERSLEARMLLAAGSFGAAVSGAPDARWAAEWAAVAVRGNAPPRERWLIVNCATSALLICGHTSEALTSVTRAIDVSRAEGDLAAFRYLSVMRSHFWFYAGDLMEAEADARTPFEFGGVQDEGAMVVAAWTLLDVLVERGRLDEAQEVLIDGGLDNEIQPIAPYLNFGLHARSRLRKAQGRLDQALDDLMLVGGSLTQSGFLNPAYMHWRSDAAEVLLGLGRPEEAVTLALEELELSRKFGAPRAIGVSLRAVALTQTGEQRIATLSEAVAVLASTTARLEEARALVDLGAVLRQANRRDEALDALRRGLDLATKANADALVNRARDELRAAGARPRRHRITGPAALTPSEHRVAVMAAEGFTNREIAQRLFVSRRTVELHLTNAFRKLGIESRQDLSAALTVAD